MSARVTIVDCGVGNIHSVEAAVKHLGAEPTVVDSPIDVANADRLILPGVGAFGEAMATIRTKGLEEAIHKYVEHERPLLGICLGMQLLFESSEEFGTHAGLGLIPGNVTAIPEHTTKGDQHHVPHVGWTQVLPTESEWTSILMSGVSPTPFYYFVHSFRAIPKISRHTVGQCQYGGHSITAVVQLNYVYGCQFHPEKSAGEGLKIMKNFVDI